MAAFDADGGTWGANPAVDPEDKTDEQAGTKGHGKMGEGMLAVNEFLRADDEHADEAIRKREESEGLFGEHVLHDPEAETGEERRLARGVDRNEYDADEHKVG